jgi:hypothetical protein
VFVVRLLYASTLILKTLKRHEARGTRHDIPVRGDSPLVHQASVAAMLWSAGVDAGLREMLNHHVVASCGVGGSTWRGVHHQVLTRLGSTQAKDARRVLRGPV